MRSIFYYAQPEQFHIGQAINGLIVVPGIYRLPWKINSAVMGMGYIAQVNIPFIICVLAMMIIMAIEILGVWGYGKLKGFVRKR